MYALFKITQRRFIVFTWTQEQFVSIFPTHDAAATFAYNIMGLTGHSFSVRSVSAAEKAALTLSLLGD